jgi:hypothetical protein
MPKKNITTESIWHGTGSLPPHMMADLFLISRDDAEQKLIAALKRVKFNKPLRSTSRAYRDARNRGGGGLRRKYVRAMMSERQNHRCCYCGVVMNLDSGDALLNLQSATIEHVIPALFGGPYHEINMAIACQDCNRKLGKTEWNEEARANLLALFPQYDLGEEWDGEDEETLHSLQFNSVSAMLPESFRKQATHEEAILATNELWLKLSQEALDDAITRIIKGKKLSSDDPLFLRLKSATTKRSHHYSLIDSLAGNQNHRCAICRKALPDRSDIQNRTSLFRIVPREYGGPPHEINYAVICHMCKDDNKRKNLAEKLIRNYFVEESKLTRGDKVVEA